MMIILKKNWTALKNFFFFTKVHYFKRFFSSLCANYSINKVCNSLCFNNERYLTITTLHAQIYKQFSPLNFLMAALLLFFLLLTVFMAWEMLLLLLLLSRSGNTQSTSKVIILSSSKLLGRTADDLDEESSSICKVSQEIKYNAPICWWRW